MAEQYCVYLKFMPYVTQWLNHTYGDPVTFPGNSKERAEILYQVKRMPQGEIPQMKKDGEVAVVIPSTAGQKAQYFNWLTKPARTALESMINNSFDRDFKLKVSRSIEHGVGVKFAVRAYIHSNGISIDYEETLLQRINRMRNAKRWSKKTKQNMQENDVENNQE